MRHLENPKDNYKEIVPIACDAMGGDFGPEVTVPAALRAIERGGVAVGLVGDPGLIQKELDKSKSSAKEFVYIIPSEGVVEEGESPLAAARQKPNASVFVCAKAARAGKVQGFVSMGSTGAIIAAATLAFGTLEGIERATLAGPIIGYCPTTIIGDLGSSVDARPAQLANFAAIGTVISKMLFGINNPRVALLSVGSEEGKGNAQNRMAYDILKASDINFIGNVEPQDLFRNKADVAACDGFTGNIIMKLVEGLGHALRANIREELDDSEESQNFARKVFEKTNTLAATYGGGPLSGLKGIAVVGHGSAKEDAITNAIHTARASIRAKFVESQEEMLQRVQTTDA